MREHKYRIWLESSKEYDYDIAIFDGQGYSLDCGLLVEPIKGDIEQYTNLKDKNGKEIYFLSDIVRATITDDLTGEQTYLDGVLYLCLKTYKIVMRGHEEFNLIFADDLEIIGNIHR